MFRKSTAAFSLISIAFLAHTSCVASPKVQCVFLRVTFPRHSHILYGAKELNGFDLRSGANLHGTFQEATKPQQQISLISSVVCCPFAFLFDQQCWLLKRRRTHFIYPSYHHFANNQSQSLVTFMLYLERHFSRGNHCWSGWKPVCRHHGGYNRLCLLWFAPTIIWFDAYFYWVSKSDN